MHLPEIMELDRTYYMNTFGARTPVAFQSGKGMYLYDTEGKEYMDFFAGIAVTALGHSHPAFVAALKSQLERLIHTSSIYYIENQARLAQTIVTHSVCDRVFFANSGAEANEGAIKLAKIYFYKKGKPEKNEIITIRDSFHGRTLATVAATGQEKYQKPYHPLTPGFRHVPLNDIAALKAAVTDHTAAIMLELIQGESGVHPATAEYLKAVQELCQEKDLLFIVDEVQTGMGRTGNLFAYETLEVSPDIFTLAKALGNGVPIGAVCAKQFVADAFEPGDHGTTFGGNPFCTAAALSVFEILEKEHLVENAKNTGAYFLSQLRSLQQEEASIVDVRGCGLMIGVEFASGLGAAIQKALFEKRFLTGCVGGATLRILPPLIVTPSEVDRFMEALHQCIKEQK